MDGLVDSVPACYGNSLGTNPDITHIYKMRDISQKIQKKIIQFFEDCVLKNCEKRRIRDYSSFLQ